MDIIVCIKQDTLNFDINEADNYALEEAVLLKEKFGGKITLISVGEEECEHILRMGLARGADDAIRITDEKFSELDGFATAQILYSVIKDIHFDIIFTGCIATDDGYSQVGPTLAELLGIPHATLVTSIEVKGGIARVHRELEAGLLEAVDIKLPALFAVQTGINKPRYASLIAIRRAASKELKVLSSKDIGLEEPRRKIKIESLFVPPVTKRAEIIEGSPPEAAAKLAEIIKEKGLL